MIIINAIAMTVTSPISKAESEMPAYIDKMSIWSIIIAKGVISKQEIAALDRTAFLQETRYVVSTL